MQFASESGLVLKVAALGKRWDRQEIGPSNPLMASHDDKDEVMKFDCEQFSCFAEERETLFFGGDTVLRIKGITQWAQGKWMKYDKYLEAINVFSRMMVGLSVKDQSIMTKKRDQRMMRRIVKDVLRSLVWRLDDAETPKYVHELMLFHLSAATQIQLIYDELLTEYKWLDCIFKNPRTETLDFVNIVLLFCHSESITFLMADTYDLSNTVNLTLMEDLAMMTEMGLEMALHFKWPSGVPESTRRSLHTVGFQCHQDEQSVTIKLEGVMIGYEAQTKFTSRVEYLIGSLSPITVHHKAKIPVENTVVPEQSEYIWKSITKIPKQLTISRLKCETVVSVELTVSGFFRETMSRTDSLFPSIAPEDVQNLIVFYHGKSDCILLHKFEEQRQEIESQREYIEYLQMSKIQSMVNSTKAMDEMRGIVIAYGRWQQAITRNIEDQARRMDAQSLKLKAFDWKSGAIGAGSVLVLASLLLIIRRSGRI